MSRKPRGSVEKSDTLARIEEKVDSISSRMDKRTGELEDKIDGISSVLSGKIEGLSTRFDFADMKVADLSSNVSLIGLRIKDLETKYDELKETVVFFRDDMFSHFDTIYKKLDFHKDEYHAITFGMRRIDDEHKIIDHRTILDRLNKLESRN